MALLRATILDACATSITRLCLSCESVRTKDVATFVFKALLRTIPA
jgi:hypothetical protein